jgi:hypothetical protein
MYLVRKRERCVDGVWWAKSTVHKMMATGNIRATPERSPLCSRPPAAPKGKHLNDLEPHDLPGNCPHILDDAHILCPRANGRLANASSSPTRLHPLQQPTQLSHLIRTFLSQSTAKPTSPVSPASAKPSASQSEPWKRRRRRRIAMRKRTCWRAAGEDGFVASRGRDG